MEDGSFDARDVSVEISKKQTNFINLIEFKINKNENNTNQYARRFGNEGI